MISEDKQLTIKQNFWHRLKLDPASLKVRLTVGIALVSAFGLGGLATWTSVRMQQILVSTHKENVQYLVERFPMDVEIYSEMHPSSASAQKALDNLATQTQFLWIKNPNGQLTAKSSDLASWAITQKLLSLERIPATPQVRKLDGRYWLLCATPLDLSEQDWGKLYIAQDITDDQIMFFSLMRSLSIATMLAITFITLAIAIYINRSLRPLKRISQLTATVSADKLSQAKIHLENAPTEVRELADTCDEMLMRLSASWEHQRELLSNVSHELRTPLTIISGYLQSVLRRSSNLTEIQQEALTTASSEAERTVQLLQDLLDLARADSGQIHYQLENIVLNDLIAEVIGMAKQYSERKIEIDTPQEIVQLKTDSNRLKQVLLNLIDNAVKYSPAEQPITLKLESHANKILIQICDRGLGISLQQQGRIFERFFRADEARNRSGGTGLGLSIVKTLVEGMGGTISVRSQLGEGSVFTVCFPA